MRSRTPYHPPQGGDRALVLCSNDVVMEVICSNTFITTKLLHITSITTSLLQLSLSTSSRGVSNL